MNILQRHLHPVQAAIIYALEPVWATILALGLEMTDWTGWIAIGGSALLAGNLMVELRETATTEHDLIREPNQSSHAPDSILIHPGQEE